MLQFEQPAYGNDALFNSFNNNAFSPRSGNASPFNNMFSNYNNNINNNNNNDNNFNNNFNNNNFNNNNNYPPVQQQNAASSATPRRRERPRLTVQTNLPSYPQGNVAFVPLQQQQQQQPEPLTNSLGDSMQQLELEQGGYPQQQQQQQYPFTPNNQFPPRQQTLSSSSSHPMHGLIQQLNAANWQKRQRLSSMGAVPYGQAVDRYPKLPRDATQTQLLQQNVLHRSIDLNASAPQYRRFSSSPLPAVNAAGAARTATPRRQATSPQPQAHQYFAANVDYTNNAYNQNNLPSPPGADYFRSNASYYLPENTPTNNPNNNLNNNSYSLPNTPQYPIFNNQSSQYPAFAASEFGEEDDNGNFDFNAQTPLPQQYNNNNDNNNNNNFNNNNNNFNNNNTNFNNNFEYPQQSSPFDFNQPQQFQTYPEITTPVLPEFSAVEAEYPQYSNQSDFELQQPLQQRFEFA
jgi:hypothetical protein